MSIVVIGGGWAGCAAALEARKKGQKVTLLERTDMLLGLGNVGGIMRNNGRYTLTEECIAMGASELFALTDKIAVHRNVNFPGHSHASFYNVKKMEPEVRRLLADWGVAIRFQTRVTDVVQTGDDCIKAVKTADDETFEGDAFVETTGTTGPMGNCMEYGNGCAMCVLRCPSFGPRVSITEKAGCRDYCGSRKDGTLGAFSGSCKLDKETLAPWLVKTLEVDGFAVVPLPEEMINKAKLGQKVCRQYALPEFADNIVLIDTGSAKMMTPYMPLEQLRRVSGFESVLFSDPYAGGRGNSIRYMACAERNSYLQTLAAENLFCGGEKAGTFVGHTEAIATGTLAGYNAVRYIKGKALTEIPEKLVLGALIKHQETEKGMITCAGDRFFEFMKARGLYSTKVEEIRARVDATGLTDLFGVC